MYRILFRTRFRYPLRFSISILLLCLLLASGVGAREVITLGTGWKFSKGPVENAATPGFNDAQWKEVDIPHDWAVSGPFIRDGNTRKLPWKGEGWYRNTLDIPEKYRGKVIYLLFDGVMAFPEVYVNGKSAGKWDYGYNSFYLDITPFVVINEKNTIAVHADTRMHDSRWYPGAGMFRKIQMIVTDPVHVDIWGTCITTPVIKSGYAEIRIESTLINKAPGRIGEITVETVIISPGGNEIARKEVITEERKAGSFTVYSNIVLDNPELWDVDHPALYIAKTYIRFGGRTPDSVETFFGIRTIRFSVDDIFFLNDRKVHFRGVNLHHDLGPLGAAFNTRAMERQLELLKEMGCNAVRTSHSIAAPELLDLCDRMGFLVFDEAFDNWDPRADITPETYFPEFAQRNIRNFILRDRNHPSVFMWSVGNGIDDIQTETEEEFVKLKIMIDCVRQYDTTRPVTMVSDTRNGEANRYFVFNDVHSWISGFDYLDESTPYSNERVKEDGIAGIEASGNSQSGIFDLCGIPKERYYLYKSLWKPEETTVHVFPHLNLNGREETKIPVTAGKPYRLKLTPDRDILHANGRDLSFVLMEAVDQEGNPCPLADMQVNLHLAGNGRIAGTGNGNPSSYEPFHSPRIKLFNGKALVIIKSGENPGYIRLDAVANGLLPAFTEIKTE